MEEKPYTPAVIMKTVCSWCKRVLREGTPGADVTHTICLPCQASFFDA